MVDVIIWVPCDRDSACAGLMAELAVTSTHAAQCPSAVFEHPNHVAYLHHGVSGPQKWESRPFKAAM